MSEKTLAEQQIDALVADARAAYPTCTECGEDIVPNDGEVCGLCARTELAAAEERGRLQGQFSPLGDNHHNAAACPYCGDLLTKAEERGRRRGVEERDELRALLRDVRHYIPPIKIGDSMRDRIDATLAPRDSAPDSVTPSALPRDEGKGG